MIDRQSIRNKLSDFNKKSGGIPYDKDKIVNSWFYKLVLNTGIRAAVGLCGGVEVIGEENIANISQDKKGFILAGVHRSWFDIGPIALALNRATHGESQVCFMGKKELWKPDNLIPSSKFLKPILNLPVRKIIAATGGNFFSAVGIFPVDRERLHLQTVRHVGRVLKSGNILGIYPEGTRGTGDKIKLEAVNLGAVTFASKYGVPIVPTGVSGTQKGDLHPMCVVFQPPIYVDQNIGRHGLEEANLQLWEDLNTAQRIASNNWVEARFSGINRYLSRTGISIYLASDLERAQANRTQEESSMSSYDPN